MRKRMTLTCLGLLAVLCISACNSKDTAQPSASTTTSEETTTVAEETTTTQENTTAVEETTTTQENTTSAKETINTISLAEWITSTEKELTEQAINEQMASSGLTIEFSADGKILVAAYHFTQAFDYSGLTKEQLSDTFEASLAESAQGLADSFRNDYHIDIDDVRIEIYSVEGTILFSKAVSEIKVQ
ncbi:MAG: DUF4854 domain-containing protein [Lachnospiraceae bacterium]